MGISQKILALLSVSVIFVVVTLVVNFNSLS